MTVNSDMNHQPADLRLGNLKATVHLYPALSLVFVTRSSVDLGYEFALYWRHKRLNILLLSLLQVTCHYPGRSPSRC